MLLHNGIDIKRFNAESVNRDKVRKEFQIDEKELVIGMVGRFSPGKGHEEFLFSAKELNKKYSSLKFMAVGEASRGENDYAENIKKLAANYQLKNLILRDIAVIHRKCFPLLIFSFFPHMQNPLV